MEFHIYKSLGLGVQGFRALGLDLIQKQLGPSAKAVNVDSPYPKA